VAVIAACGTLGITKEEMEMAIEDLRKRHLAVLNAGD
jgi:hypothetical protein